MMKLLGLPARLICTVISMLSGVLGFSWAVNSYPSGTGDFVQASLVALIAQTFLFSIASNRKYRFLKGWRNEQLHLRSSISISLSTLITLLLGLLSLSFWNTISGTGFYVYITLMLCTCTLQLLSFPASSRQQVVDLNRFWIFQLIGSITRLLAIIVLVLALDASFLGILWANTLAATVIALLYSSLKFSVSSFVRDMRLSIRYFRSLIRLDGILRAFRLSYEQQVMLAFVIISDFAFLGSGSKTESAYASTGFLNAGATALRQIFASAERQAFFGTGRTKKLVLLWISCLLAAIILWDFDKFTNAHLYILPDLDHGGTSTILRAISVYVALYPLTLGFAFADYLPTAQLKVLATCLAVSTAAAVLFAAFFQSYWIAESPIDDIWPLWAAIPGATIGLSLGYLRWRGRGHKTCTQ